MKRILLIASCFILVFSSCKKNTETPAITYDNLNTKNVSKIAFGSCYFQQLGLFQPGVFDKIDQKAPDMYLSVGDAIYSDDYTGAVHDTDWTSYLTMRYNELFAKPTWQNFQNKYTIHATWDDHDFGPNNSVGNFAHKQDSKSVFFDMWKLPKSGKRWDRNGIYDVFYYGDESHRVQILMLDQRWDRSDLGSEPISATTDPSKIMMSDEEWSWLKTELAKPAKVRIICSGTQFCTEHNGYEAWANMPLQQEKMYQTIKDAKAEGVFFISGDVHIAEVNKRTPSGLYPIWDFTSSGLAQLHGSNTQPSQYRVGAAFDQNNFGMLDIDWSGASPVVNFTAFDDSGNSLLQQSISMADLKLP